MGKFKKLNRAEMKKIAGGTVHTCFVTCLGNQEYFVTVPDCVNRTGVCLADNLGEYISCICR